MKQDEVLGDFLKAHSSKTAAEAEEQLRRTDSARARGKSAATEALQEFADEGLLAKLREAKAKKANKAVEKELKELLQEEDSD